MEKTYVLSFKGNKAELHAQLKAQCALAGKTINGTVLELISDYLDKQREEKELARLDKLDQEAERRAFYKENPNERI